MLEQKRALKSTIIEVQALCTYAYIYIVSLSHFTDPKMADPGNVWDLPIKFFLAYIYVYIYIIIYLYHYILYISLYIIYIIIYYRANRAHFVACVCLFSFPFLQLVY